MNEFELTLLTAEQIWGSKNKEQLEVLRKYGTGSAATDLAILKGVYTSYDLCYTDLYQKYERKAMYWTSTPKDKERMVICTSKGTEKNWRNGNRNAGIRPVLNSNKIFEEVYSKRKLGENGTFEVEYGEYPQMLVDKKTQVLLENIYLLEQLKKEEQRTKIKKTGKSYTFDSLPASEVNCDRQIVPVFYDEFSYNNQKYIRIWENCDRYLWVKVEPIIWLLDEENKSLISKKVLLSGIRFAPRLSSNVDFANSDMKYYFDNFMNYEILSSSSPEFINMRLKKINEEQTRLMALRDELLDNKKELRSI